MECEGEDGLVYGKYCSYNIEWAENVGVGGCDEDWNSYYYTYVDYEVALEDDEENYY